MVLRNFTKSCSDINIFHVILHGEGTRRKSPNRGTTSWVTLRYDVITKLDIFQTPLLMKRPFSKKKINAVDAIFKDQRSDNGDHSTVTGLQHAYIFQLLAYICNYLFLCLFLVVISFTLILLSFILLFLSFFFFILFYFFQILSFVSRHRFLGIMFRGYSVISKLFEVLH